MMIKQLVPLFMTLLPFIGIAQAPQTFRFQMMISEPASIFGQQATLVVSVRDKLSAGNVVFTETHTETVGPTGLVNLEIGSNSDLSTVDWSILPLYLELSINDELIGTTEIVSVPQVLYAEEAATVQNLDFGALTNFQPDQDQTDDFSGDYNDLLNKPTTTITSNQSDKVDRITATNSIDLDDLANQVSINNTKTSFPGFGTTAGTAFIQKWSKINNDLFLSDGNAGINTSVSSDATIALDVGAAIKMDPMSSPSATPGLIFFDQASGLFKFHNQLGNPSDLVTAPGEFLTGVETSDDVNIQGQLSVGPASSSPTTTLTLSSNTPIIRFEDTSSSASFGTVDWDLTANDPDAGGANYFAVSDRDNVRKPFYVSQMVPTNSLYMDNVGNLHLGGSSPAAKLDASGGQVTATTFTGNASQLTGLIGTGTSSVTNTGSTTIGADTDGSGDGSIIFETASTTRMTVSPEGNVGIGTAPSSTEVLTVSGTSVASQITVGPAGTSLDVAGLHMVVYDSDPGFFLNLVGNVGQEVIIVNKSSGTFFLQITPGALQLPQYGTVTVVNVEGSWYVKYKSI